MEERLQKILSAAGICSRRAAEGYILDGRVAVNGTTAQLGQRADPNRDVIAVDGASLAPTAAPVYLMLYKPRGYVSTLSDEQGRRNVAQLVSGCGARVWPVGRLDLDSEGLLLMTNDGVVTNLLTHPSHEVEKEYHVTVTGEVEAALPVLRGPMYLDGSLLRTAQVKRLGEGQLSVVIHEGKNRQVRRMCDQAGLAVTRLCRVREGPLTLRDLKPGQWRLLEEKELAWLLSL